MKKKHWALALPLYFVGLLLAWLFSSWLAELATERLSQSLKDEAQEELLLAKSQLESALFRDVFLADSLATVFTIDPDEAFQNFESIAKQLMSKATFVRNVGVAPDDIIRKNYPLAGNEKAIGLDLKSLVDQYPTVLKARELKDVFLAGPLELVQGGRAIIVRLPIFYDYPRSDNYWGVISVVIDYTRLMESAGLLSNQQYTIAIRGVNGSGRGGQIFEGKEVTFEQFDYEGPLIIPNGEWWVSATFDVSLTNAQKAMITLGQWALITLYSSLFWGAFVLWKLYRTERLFANEDVLTKIKNRRFALSYLQGLISKGRSSKFAVFVIDLNRFKYVNDNYGHEAGDQLLRRVALSLSEVVRGGDVVARMGGDEFLIIANRLNESEAQKLAEKIKRYGESLPITVGDEQIYPSLSIGLAICGEGDGTPENLLQLADQRMYRDKTACASQPTELHQS